MAEQSTGNDWADNVIAMLETHTEFSMLFPSANSGDFLITFKAVSLENQVLIGEVTQPIDLAEGEIKSWLIQCKDAEEPLYVAISFDGATITKLSAQELSRHGL